MLFTWANPLYSNRPLVRPQHVRPQYLRQSILVAVTVRGFGSSPRQDSAELSGFGQAAVEPWLIASAALMSTASLRSVISCAPDAVLCVCVCASALVVGHISIYVYMSVYVQMYVYVFMFLRSYVFYKDIHRKDTPTDGNSQVVMGILTMLGALLSCKTVPKPFRRHRCRIQ